MKDTSYEESIAIEAMESVESAASNSYTETGKELADRIEVDIENIEGELALARDALSELQMELDDEE